MDASWITGLMIVISGVLALWLFGTGRHRSYVGTELDRSTRDLKPTPSTASVSRPKTRKAPRLFPLQVASAVMGFVMLASLGLLVFGLVDLANTWWVSSAGLVGFACAVIANRGIARQRKSLLARPKPARVARASAPSSQIAPVVVEESGPDRSWSPVKLPAPRALQGSLEQPRLAKVVDLADRKTDALESPKVALASTELDEILRRRRSAG